MHRLLLALAAFFSVYANPSYAKQADCSSVFIEHKAMGKIRNQGVAGLCFAFAGADLASWWVGKRVSAFDVALFEFQNSTHKLMTQVYSSGGDTVAAVNEGFRSGLCSEADLPSDEPFIDWSKNPKAPLFTAVNTLEGGDWSSAEVKRAAKLLFPNVTSTDIKDAGDKPSFRERFFHLRDKNCEARLKSANGRLLQKFSETEAGYIALVDEELNKNLPVGIAFSSNSIYKEQDEEDGHVVTIVGRRWNKKRRVCEYLVRDTFGEQCHLYKDGIECHKGYVWLRASLLKKNMFEVMSFK